MAARVTPSVRLRRGCEQFTNNIERFYIRNRIRSRRTSDGGLIDQNYLRQQLRALDFAARQFLWRNSPRFGFVGRLDLYDPADLRAIVERSARILKVVIDDEGAIRISERSRGTPRVANRLLRRVRDFAEVRGDGIIDGAIASDGLELFGVDELGLDKVDRAILATLCGRFGGQPVGLTTLAQCVGEETDTIEDAYEPFLLQSGLIQRTSRGRVATLRAWAHLGQQRPSATSTTPLF